MCKKLKTLHQICLAIALAKINHFFIFFLSKFVAVVALDTVDAPTSKKYNKAEANFFQIHENYRCEYWEHCTIFGLKEY